MFRSVNSRYTRFLAAPVAALLIVGLQPDPAVASAARQQPALPPVAATGGAPTTTRLPLAAGLPTAPTPGSGAPQPTCDPKTVAAAKSTAVQPKTATRITFDGATLVFPPGAVKTETTISATALCDSAMSKMDTAMTNVTAGPRRGYRFLPHQSFINDITVTLPYDPALIPLGLTELDVYTYFYDLESESWRALQRVSIDTVAHTVTSFTDHFTDFVNATLTIPDHPETMAYDPTSMKDIKAADPGTGINLIAPPQPGNRGDAGVGYPIELPPGRNGMTPSLSLRYDSSGGAGWLGTGWDLASPSVTIDTRWGVPRYSGAMETETYTLNGSQLTPMAHRGALQARTAEKVFHTRVEGQFATIMRHGSSP